MNPATLMWPKRKGYELKIAVCYNFQIFAGMTFEKS